MVMLASGRKNLLAGIFTVAFGAFAIWHSYGYSIGTLRQMGPGFFPMALGIILIGLGIGIVLQALKSDEHFAQVRLRPLILLPSAIAMFALLINRVGFVAASLVLVAMTGLADRNISKPTLAVLSVVLVALAYIIFGLVLGMPMELFVWNP